MDYERNKNILLCVFKKGSWSNSNYLYSNDSILRPGHFSTYIAMYYKITPIQLIVLGVPGKSYKQTPVNKQSW